MPSLDNPSKAENHPRKPLVSVSIVSHGQMLLVSSLLDDLKRHSTYIREVILTLNVPEGLALNPNQFPFPIKIISNTSPKGFAANHNSAFKSVTSPYFCVLNPDVRFISDPFPVLIQNLQGDGIGVIAPAVYTPHGQQAHSARAFPTPFNLIWRIIFRRQARVPQACESMAICDWVAGMFMLFPSPVFLGLKGFDERYFLYYEDVDICARIKTRGGKTAQCRSVRIIHDARQQSHKEWRYFRWHILSLAKYFTSLVFYKITYLKLKAYVGRKNY